MRSILFYVFLFISSASFSQNGYTLEFESTILLSLDTIGNIPANTTKTKSFTVPAGMVLKINSGIIGSVYVNTGLYQNSWLMVGDLRISTPAKNNEQTGQFNTASLTIGGGRDGMGPIWANEGTEVKINALSNSNGNAFFTTCWIGGVLFRKIAN